MKEGILRDQVSLQKGENIMDALSRALGFKTYLDSLPLGFGADSAFDKLVGPYPLMADDREASRLMLQAPVLKSCLAKCLALYNLGLTDPNWSWVTSLVDGRASDREVEISHRCALFEERTAVLVRADQPDFGVSVELQIPGAGWGFMDSISRLMRGFARGVLGVGFAEGMNAALLEISGKEEVRILHASNGSRYLQEQTYFASVCDSVGAGRISISISPAWNISNNNGFDVIRRPMLDDFLSFRGVETVLERYFLGNLQIEPPPSLVYGQKVILTLLFDPRSRDYFTDEERTLFPETYLVRPDFVPELNGERFRSWMDLSRLPSSKRRFILKYAGSDPHRRGGASEVWSLESGDSSRDDVARRLAMALMDWERGEPWILQRRVKRKFEITYLGLDGTLHTEPMYARITPMYNLGESPRLIGVTANFRRMWKVHGQTAREGDPNVLLAVHGAEG